MLDDTLLPDSLQSPNQSPIGKMQDLSMVANTESHHVCEEDCEEDSEEECKTSDEEIEIVRLHSQSIIEIDDEPGVPDAKVPQTSSQEASQQAVEAPAPLAAAPPVKGSDDKGAETAQQVEEIIDSDDDQGNKGVFKVGSWHFCSTKQCTSTLNSIDNDI